MYTIQVPSVPNPAQLTNTGDKTAHLYFEVIDFEVGAHTNSIKTKTYRFNVCQAWNRKINSIPNIL